MRWLPLVLVAAAIGCGSVSTHDPNPDAPTTGAGMLALQTPTRWVPQSGSVAIGFTITRGAMTTGALQVHVTGLPAGVTAADVAVAASDSTGMLVFAASASAALGSSTAVNVQLLDGSKMLDQQPFTVFVSGAPGALDTTFGTQGRVTLPLPDPALGLGSTGNGLVRSVVQYPASAGANAGKLVVAVQLDTTGATSTTRKLAIVRFTVDGSVDTTFGGGTGYAVVDGSAANAFWPAQIALDSQGRVVLAATLFDTANVCRNYVTRLTATGLPDATFTTYNSGPPGGYCGNAVALAVLPGDKLELLGYWNNPDQSQRPLLMQLGSDGTPDTTAFAGGNYTVRVPNPDSTKPTMIAQKLLVDAQGRFVIAGMKCEGGWATTYSACESVIGRLNSDGTWDHSFGTAGAGNLGYSALVFGTTAAQPQYQSFGSIALDANQNVVAVGWDENYTTATLARFTASGAVDTSFGTSGRLAPVLVQGGTVQELDDVAIDAQGNVVAAGYANAGGPLIVTTRYTANGTLDTTYGTAGVSTAPSAGLGPKSLLQVDGRLIVAGAYPRNGGGSDIALWRFWP